MKDEIWTIDFEASSLDMIMSYPIEVGYFNGVIERSMLIRPLSTWTDWDNESQAIHGIDRYELLEGLTVIDVAEQMNKDLVGNKVWCDGGLYDQTWNFRIFDAAGIEPKFQVLHYQPIGMDENVIHRALPDAKQLWYHIKKENDARENERLRVSKESIR